MYISIIIVSLLMWWIVDKLARRKKRPPDRGFEYIKHWDNNVKQTKKTRPINVPLPMRVMLEETNSVTEDTDIDDIEEAWKIGPRED